MTSNAIHVDLNTVPCSDIQDFQEILMRSRTVDDRVIYELNKIIPTASFAQESDIPEKCKNLYKKLQDGYDMRESALKRCISEHQHGVNELRSKVAADSSDLKLINELRKRQTQLRMVQSEVNIEEVIRDRSLKAFHERCRDAYRPVKI